MDSSYSKNTCLASPTTKQSPLMQFRSSPQDPLLDQDNKLNRNNNNNNSNDNLFSVQSKCSVDTTAPNRLPDFQSVGSSSPQLSSTSSVSSHAANNDDCDVALNARNSSPPSPQSSYNSSFGSNSGRELMNNSRSSITSQVPGGVVTTQNISTVIRPKGNTNSLQFVKIQPPDLSKKAVEQIRIAQETKISRDKIKEVEEEWQSNLLNWKSKRRQQFSHNIEHESNNSFETNENGSGRKIKTFAEMMEQRAKSGNRLGFHLQRYIGADDEDENQLTPPNEKQTDSFEHLVDRADSDRQAPSNTSSCHSPTDTHTRISSSASLNTPKVENDSNASAIGASESDNYLSSAPCDEKDHSISIVDNSKSDQLNSTLKEGMKQPDQLNPSTKESLKQPEQLHPTLRECVNQPDQLIPAIKEILKQPDQLSSSLMGAMKQSDQPVVIRNEVPRQSSLRSNDCVDADREGDNSAFEEEEEEEGELEEEEEEEEQKHLQRVAFVAKLKAFENLAKPAIQIPMPLPNRTATRVPKDAPPKPPQNTVPIVKPPIMERPRIPEPKAIEKPLQLTKQVKPIIPPERLRSTSSCSAKDDKDRTVLSVSGKKRCSSCKEELGRGAAAFVVESLSLVYHTNCFRCSVCHVNLSNGFRGVDVRVHAGALHCQNCYSKDGLNYSRV